MTDLEIFSLRVKEIRISSGMTQEQFAVAVGIHKNEIRMIENGEAEEIGLIEAKKISKFAGLHVSELFEPKF